MVVVLGPGWPGVLLHEAVGHGLEGDFNRKGTSVFSGRVGEQVASELCTIVDDGTIPDRRGSLSVDDEGTQAQRTVLIENGVLERLYAGRYKCKTDGTRSDGEWPQRILCPPPDAQNDEYLYAAWRFRA